MKDENPYYSSEPWVDVDTVAAHFGLHKETIRKMAIAREIPCIDDPNGKRKFRRFRISQVEAALLNGVPSRLNGKLPK